MQNKVDEFGNEYDILGNRVQYRLYCKDEKYNRMCMILSSYFTELESAKERAALISKQFNEPIYIIKTSNVLECKIDHNKDNDI